MLVILEYPPWLAYPLSFARAPVTTGAGHGAALRLSHQSPGYNRRYPCRCREVKPDERPSRKRQLVRNAQ